MAAYCIPARRGEARIVEKKSEFIGVCAPAATESEALQVLGEVRRAHRAARHHVFAYSLREGARTRYSDDGEPAKTAGLPVLEAIRHAALCDCIVVVTRYFGGTLLGTGGLVRAYTAAAGAAIKAAGAATMRECVTLRLEVEYPLYEPARALLEAAGAHFHQPAFTQRVALAATLPAEDAPALRAALNELCRGAVPIQVSKPLFLAFES